MSKFEFFPGFIGNSRITNFLEHSIVSGKTANALLFTGPEGCGRKTLAEKYAHRLLCPNLCGDCKNCVMIGKGMHPDLLFVYPDGNVLKLEQSRQIKAFLSAPPNTAPFKVAVIVSCEKLTVEAGNSLLKIIEEPPLSSVCIMTADTVENVLPTLVSRSQTYKLAPLSTREVETVLAGMGLPSTRAGFLAHLSQGILGKALALLEDQDFFLQREKIAVEISDVLARRMDPLLVSEHWQQKSDKTLDLLEIWLRDMLLMQTREGYTPINSDLLAKLSECISICPCEKTMVLLDQCAEVRRRLMARCNPQLAFDGLVLKMWEV